MTATAEHKALKYRGDKNELFLQHPEHGWLRVYGERGDNPMSKKNVRQVRKVYLLTRSNSGSYYFKRAWEIEQYYRNSWSFYYLTKARYEQPLFNDAKAARRKRKGIAYKWVREVVYPVSEKVFTVDR